MAVFFDIYVRELNKDQSMCTLYVYVHRLSICDVSTGLL